VTHDLGLRVLGTLPSLADQTRRWPGTGAAAAAPRVRMVRRASTDSVSTHFQ
jgi:hypothetical protein